MPIMTYKMTWPEDNSIVRYIEVDTQNTFKDLHETILLSMEFDNKHEGRFYTSNKNWKRLRGISSSVKKNISDAEYLSAAKTPVSALVASPDQRFIYDYDSKGKLWTFELEMIQIEKEPRPRVRYPNIATSEGLPPSQYSPNVMKSSPGVKEVEEQLLDQSEIELNDDLSLNEES